MSSEHLDHVVDTDPRAVAIATAPRSLVVGGPSGHLRAMLLSEHKIAELRRRYGPPRGGGGGCGKGCLVIAIPVIAIFILGLVLTLATRLG